MKINIKESLHNIFKSIKIHHTKIYIILTFLTVFIPLIKSCNDDNKLDQTNSVLNDASEIIKETSETLNTFTSSIEDFSSKINSENIKSVTDDNNEKFITEEIKYNNNVDLKDFNIQKAGFQKGPILQESSDNIKEILLDMQLASDKLYIYDSYWVDLIGNGKYLELCIHYGEGDRSFLAVVSIRNNRKELLFYDKFFAMEGYTPLLFFHNGKPLLFLYNVVGSGHFFGYKIYSYDKVSGFNMLYESDSKPDGWFRFIDNRLFVESGLKKFELIYEDDNYKEIEYKDELVYEDGSSNNILSFKNNPFRILINDKEIEFSLTDGDISYSSIDTYKIELYDILTIYDNSKDLPHNSYKLFSIGDGNTFIPGFYSKIRFSKLGYVELVLRIDYRFYTIKINVIEDKFIEIKAKDKNI